jgi:hypothetical protein
MKSLWGNALGAGALGALVLTVGCGGANSTAGIRAQELTGAAQQAGLPVVVSCEPHQRALVRPTVVNGATVSQVECVAADQQAAYAQGYAPVAQATPVAYGYTAPVARYSGVSDARVVPVRSYEPARVVRTRQVYQDPVRVNRGRSVKKSAIIIGSSAGVGAGVGAAVGGKKGALIGAAIGGGGAAIWDQITRRK